MNKTFDYRRSILQDKNILQEFPRFMDIPGLINDDFSRLFSPSKSLEEFVKKFGDKMLTIYKNTVNRADKNITGGNEEDNVLENIWSRECRVFLAILLMLPPTAKGRKKIHRVPINELLKRLKIFCKMEDTGSMSATRRCIVAVLCGRASLFLLMTGYALFGAILFESIEGGEEEVSPVDFQKNREECLRELWLITERLNVLYEKNWTKLVTEQLRKFEKAVVEFKRLDSSSSSDISHWNFGEALLYSVTILTTVGYGKLSPKTALGKVATMLYAIVGVPLMLLLLSALGSLLASGAKKSYSRLCCQTNKAIVKSPSVGYHKAPSSPSGRQFCKSHEDSASIQTSSVHNTPNHVNFQPNHQTQYIDQAEIPKRSLLATVRASHTRGRCRQGSIRQTLAESSISVCPTHSHHAVPMRNMNSSIVGIAVATDVEEPNDTDDIDQIICAHHTPSRMPLIWRTPEHERSPAPILSPSPSVPALLVLIIFVSYICAGAFAFSTTSSRSFLDAIYFCFIALSTIGIGDSLPPTTDVYAQLQLLACCVYIFLGLIVVAMCFSLVQEEVTFKCRQIANSLGLIKN